MRLVEAFGRDSRQADEVDFPRLMERFRLKPFRYTLENQNTDVFVVCVNPFRCYLAVLFSELLENVFDRRIDLTTRLQI